MKKPKVWHCLRCLHFWMSRPVTNTMRPARCAKCGDPNWHRPYTHPQRGNRGVK